MFKKRAYGLNQDSDSVSYVSSFFPDGLDSNDVLYGSDVEFIGCVNGMATQILGEVLSAIETLGSSGSGSKQSVVAFKLFEAVVGYADLDLEPALGNMARKLWKLSAGSDSAECAKWRQNFLDNIVVDNNCENSKLLVSKLKRF